MIVACDGAARGNPGPAGIGVQITDTKETVLAEVAEAHGLPFEDPSALVG